MGDSDSKYAEALGKYVNGSMHEKQIAPKPYPSQLAAASEMESGATKGSAEATISSVLFTTKKPTQNQPVQMKAISPDTDEL